MTTLNQIKKAFKTFQVQKVIINESLTYFFDCKNMTMQKFQDGYEIGKTFYYENETKFNNSIKRAIKLQS